jgi:hypothetical protein
LPESTNFARPSGKEAIELFDISLTNTTVNFPNPKYTVPDIEDPASRNVEYDAKLYYPSDVYRKPTPIWPKDFKIDIKHMLRDKIVSKIRSVFGDDK